MLCNDLLKLYMYICSIYLKYAEVYINKRYSIIDQQLARHFVQCSECPLNPLSLYATQIINPFLNSGLSAKHAKGL